MKMRLREASNFLRSHNQKVVESGIEPDLIELKGHMLMMSLYYNINSGCHSLGLKFEGYGDRYLIVKN